MNIYRKLTIFTLFILFIFCGQAQEYSYDTQHINVEERLPDRRVLNILQDKNGFIWVNTPGALSRYDGYHFKTYSASLLNVSESAKLEMAVDHNNHIWFSEVRYGQGFSGVIDTEKDTLYTLEDYTKGQLSSKNILYIRASKSAKDVFLLTTKKGEAYAYKEGELQLIHKLQISEHQPFICEQAKDESYWVFGEKKAIQIKGNRKKVYHLPDYVRGLIQQESDLILEMHDFSYMKLQDEKFISYSPVPDLFRMIENEGYKGYITGDQLQLYYKNDSIAFNSKDIMPGCQGCRIKMTTSIVDNQNNLWLATENGLLKIATTSNKFQVIDRGNSIRGIALFDSLLWLGGYIKNNRYELNKEVPTIFISNDYGVVFDFCEDEKGHLWAATTSNLFKFSSDELNTDTFPVLRKGITCLLHNPATDNLIAGTEKGIGYFDLQLKKFFSYQLPIPSKSVFVRHLFKNSQGIWAVSNQGLFLFNEQTEKLIRHYSMEDGLPTNNINHAYEDQQSIFWLATKANGLIRWDIENNIFKQYTIAEGLSNNTLYAVYEDDYNNLWLPSNYGLMCFNKNTASTKVFFPKHGIAHEEFNNFAHYQDATGKLYFGGLDGVTIFHPKEVLEMDKEETPLYLTKVSILQNDSDHFENRTEAFNKIGRIILSPNDRVLEVDFSLLDYQQSALNQYAYKIEGQQEQWIYTNENQLPLMNLPYGKYNLTIKGRGISGDWSSDELVVPMEVQAPLYKQSWFQLLLVALGVGIIIAVVKWRINALQKDRQRLEAEVQKRTQKIEEDKLIILEQSEELKKLDKAKTKFFSNITHEFRTPLTLIIGSTEQLLTETKQIQHKKQYRVLKNAKHLLGLVNQLLDLSKLEVGRMKLELSRGDIVQYTGALVEQLESMATHKNQRLAFLKSNIVWNTVFDKDKWDKIIYNLVSNAIKFTPEGGAIQLCLRKMSQGTSEWINLEVKDTGRGIAQDQLSNIFNRFYQVDGSLTREQEGTGIGLALVKELVELQDGEIWVTSEIGKGTSFEIKIPVPIANSSIPALQELSSSIPMAAPIMQIPIIANTPATVSSSNKELLKLLIVEDNEEMRAYIKECIGEHQYQIQEASNGKEGVRLAMDEVPDLIISDVMMPVMDGYQLTQTIRSTITTSHIPIVLLTARASMESRLEGFQRGADAYLNKPFSVKELKLRVRKLIEIRQLLQLRYSNETYIRPESSNNTFAKEDAFINELKTYIIENLTEEALNGETIGKHFGMSRMQLHRKLRALTNQTTSEFINNIRLDKALTLLQNKQFNISEVAYQSGFSSPKYFSKLFKEKFGKSPSNFSN